MSATTPGTRQVPAWALALPVLVVLLAVSAGVALVVASRPSSSVWVASGHAIVGGTSPNFTTQDLGGKRVSLSDFSGRPVLLSFWATWCTVCHDELPALQRLQDRYRSGGFAVLLVNYRETSNDRMRQYLSGLQVNLEAVIDPDGAVASAYGVDIGLPVNILSGRSGKVARILVGEVPIATIEAAIQQAVSAPPG
ncbi:MAG TPA: TlpA disulfide reductase family protein [Candidatus Dormibacteraeota bacterium]|nr:TlpA disulfide reductase family protein [Candidatus Dormibacteraeota bacterium]